MLDKLLSKGFPWLVTIIIVALLFAAGYDRWELGDKPTASTIWISILPISAILFCIIITGQASLREEDDEL